MSLLVARQPIFDEYKNVFGYEILYRSNEQNHFSGANGDHATTHVLTNTFMLIGIEELTEGKLAFINFTENLLKNEIATIFPKEFIAIEILESINPTSDIVLSCKRLKEMGYLIVLDDFIYSPQFTELLTITDIVKIDFRSTSSQDIRKIIKVLQPRGIKFLAEKVETLEEFELAKSLGFSYFQGYFFCKPSIVSTRDLPSIHKNKLTLIQEIYKEDPDINRLASIIERDLSLSYKLLRLVNSAAFQSQYKITSIKHAVVMLGIVEMKKWASIVLNHDFSADKPAELLNTSLIRAKFMEQLCIKIGSKARSSEAFLIGMFSLIDVLLERHLADILETIPLSMEIKAALLGEENVFQSLFFLVQAYEKGEFVACETIANSLKIDSQELTHIYLESVKWATNLAKEI